MNYSSLLSHESPQIVRPFRYGWLWGITGCDPLDYFVHTCTIKSPSKISSNEVEQFIIKYKHNNKGACISQSELTRVTAISNASPLKYYHPWLTAFAYLTCTSPCRLPLVLQRVRISPLSARLPLSVTTRKQDRTRPTPGGTPADLAHPIRIVSQSLVTWLFV